MRKLLLSTIALLMTISVMAIGLGDGLNKVNAIDFDWTNGHKPALSAGLWYRVDLSPLKAEANDPTLALYLTNLSDATASVSLKLEASLLGKSMNQTSNYNIAAKDYQLWSKQSFDYNGRKMSLKQLMTAGLSEVYLQLTSNGEIALSAKVYETADIVDDACSKAKDFNWAGVSVPVGEQWYRLNLSDVKTNGKKLNFVVKNNGASVANVAFDMSLDCPASAVIEKYWTIAAGAEKEDEFGRIFLDVLNEDYVFVKLATNQPLTLSVEEEVVVVDPSKFADFDCASAPELVFDQVMNLTAGKHVYKVKRADLIAERDFDTEFNVTNLTGETANLAVEVAFACPVKSVVTQNLVLNANESIMKLVKGDMLKAVNSEWVYIRFIADKDLTATVGVRNVSPCVNALPFDWNSGAKLDAGESQWYEMDITTLKQNKKHLGLRFTNYADAVALVNVEVALDCEGTILPITLPVPAGLSISQVIDYQLLAHSPLNRIYVGVSTDSDIELAAWTKNAIATDKTPCLNALNPEYGVEYQHEANTTKWYKVSLDLLESPSAYSSFYLANKGNKRANVTIGVVTDCQYTPSTKITLPMPAKIDFGTLTPNVLGRLLQQVARFERAYNKVDAKDIYLEITSDQPIGFGLDVVNSTTSPCLREDLIAFDWNKGAKVEAGDAKWFDMNLSAVKDAGKHVKLTFTNHTDSLVWAATVVSAACPAKLTMPLIVPVPAGMSVDHVINYQLLAVADLPNLYIGVLADGALELKAESIDATIVPSADCLAAKKIVSGERFVQNPGSQWYQFPMSLIDEMGSVAKLTFENMTSNHATLSAGVSVGCEYTPVTCAKIKALRSLDMSFNMPKKIIAKLRGLIDPNIAEFYIQLTTDQTIAFTFDTQAAGMNVCSSAIDFDWKTWEVEGAQLAANQDVWYKVNLDYPLEKIRKGEDLLVSVANVNDVAINVDFSVSPTCPVMFSLDKSVSIPAHVKKQVHLFSYADVVSLVERYDHYKDLVTDPKKLVEKLETYAFYNKLQKEFNKYDRFVPYGQIESFLNVYGEYISYTGVKELFANYDKYLSVAEIKQQLALHKEYISKEDVENVFRKCDDYITFVDAEKLLSNYDLVLPYAGGVVKLLNKCKLYITKENLKQAIDRCVQYVPVDEIKQLLNRIDNRLRQYLPTDKAIYLNIKTDGDFVVNPDTVIAGCDKADDYVWGTNIQLNADEDKWYKLAVADIQGKECDITLTATNASVDTIKATVDLYEDCPAENHIVTVEDLVIAPNSIMNKTVSSDKLPDNVDFIYLRIKANGEMTAKMELSCMEFEYDSVYSYGCDDLMWNDTVQNGTLFSVLTHVVKRFELPIEMTDSILATIPGAEPQLKQGLMPNTTASVTAIKAYYDGLDTEAMADVVNVTWEPTVEVDCEATTHTISLIVVDACGDTIKTTHTFSVTPKEAGATIDAVICADEVPYVWNGVPYFTTDVYYDTLVSAITSCDSVITLNLTVLPVVVDSVMNVTISRWESYVWPVNGNEYANQSVSESVVVANQLGCDSIVYTLNLTVKNVLDSMVVGLVCDGTEYVDPITNEKKIISSLIPSTSIWSDTIIGASVDTIYNFAITPIVAPVVINDSILATISNANPVLVQGEKSQVEASIAAIKNYYQSEDTEAISDVLTVTWSNVDAILACDAQTHTMVLTVEDNCGNVLKSTFTFDVDERAVGEVVTNAAICQGGAYTWTDGNGNTYNVAGQYRDTVRTAFGCDSIVRVLYLTVNTPVAAEVTATACGSYVWNGTTYTASGDYTYTTTAVNGCDSTITLHLTINTPVTAEVTATACGSYVWNGTTYTASGNYTYTTTAVNGCDSTITLHLTINTPVTAEVTATACGSYVWNGTTYTASGDYTYTTTAANGCDSVVTLHLILNQSVATEETVVVCGSYSWNGQEYTTSGDYTFTATAANGCDSVVTLHLTINQPVATEETVVTCGSYSWNSQDYATSGDYTYTTTAANGCDSVVTLHLTILPEAVTENEKLIICESEFPYEWRGEVLTAVGTYTVVEQYTSASCDSVIHVLDLQSYVMTLPVNVTEPIAICGEPVDVVDATADIEAHIAATNLYAPNSVVNWYIYNNGDSTLLTNDPIKGGAGEIIVKYVITSDCGTLVSEAFTLTVEVIENGIDVDDVLAISKYDNRIFLLHLNDFVDRFGWTPTPDEVTWYKVVNEDESGVLEDDIQVGTGHSYNEPDGSVIAPGKYYALIRKESADPEDCDGQTIMRTVVLSSGVETKSPQLISNVVRPNDNLTLINLNADMITEVRVYNMMGELVDIYIADQVSEFVFNAAHASGYYLIDVQTATDKATLRYIVK